LHPPSGYPNKYYMGRNDIIRKVAVQKTYIFVHRAHIFVLYMPILHHKSNHIIGTHQN